METFPVDMDLSLEILGNYNAGKYDNVKPIESTGIPGIDGETVLDMTAGAWELEEQPVLAAAGKFDIPRNLIEAGTRRGGRILFTADILREVGTRLFPLLSVGVLNGGSATSYLDRKKNRSFHPDLFDLYADVFEAAAEQDAGKPKGIVPGYVNPDGSPGFSFMEMRMRNLLIEILRYREMTGSDDTPLYPLFQMTSIHTERYLAEAYEDYRGSPALKDLIRG